MRIGLVVEQFDPRRGGLEQWSAQFVQRMAKRGHEVHVAARRFGDEAQKLPIVAHRLEGVHSRLEFAESAERLMASLAPDVVHDTGAGWHCHIFQPHGGSRRTAGEQNLLLYPAWWRPFKRTLDPLLPRHRELDRLMARQYANDGRIFLALSRRVAADFQHWHGVPPERIRVVYNGVDVDRFTPDNQADCREAVRYRLKVDDRTTLLLIAAHNFALKGVPSLLEAMRRLAARGQPVHLLVVGGKRVDRWTRIAQRMGAGAAVTFLGTMSDMAPLYAAADVYVQPTFYDPCSLVVLEALAAGLPVITTHFNGVSELLTEGQEGFILADPRGVETLVDRIQVMLEPTVRDRMARAARQLALRHTLDHNCEQIEAVYQELLAARRRVAAA